MSRFALALSFIVALAGFSGACARADSVQSPLDQAQALADAGQYKEAVALLDTYLQAHPHDPRAYVERGDAKAALNNNSGALDDYNKAIVIDPEYAYAYATRCETRLELDDSKGALDDCNKAIELNPKSGQAFEWRGDVYFDGQRYELALADYDKAEALGQHSSLLYSDRCNTERYLNTLNRAQDDCRKALSLAPTSKRALWAHARLMATMSNYSSAIGDWNAYITGLDSPDSVAYYFRAEALNKLERYKLALDDLDIYVKHHPDDGDGYQQRAIAQANLGDKASAITALRSAAVAYRKEGQDDDATRVERMIADLQAGKAIH